MGVFLNFKILRSVVSFSRVLTTFISSRYDVFVCTSFYSWENSSMADLSSWDGGRLMTKSTDPASFSSES